MANSQDGTEKPLPNGTNNTDNDEIEKLSIKERLECQKIQTEIARSEEEKKKIELERKRLEKESKSHLYKKRHLYQAIIAGFILVPLGWFYVKDVALPLSSRENIKLSKELKERNQELIAERKALDEMILQHEGLQNQKIQLEAETENLIHEKDLLVEKNAKLLEDYTKKNMELYLVLQDTLKRKNIEAIDIDKPLPDKIKEDVKQYGEKLAQVKTVTEYSFEDWYNKGVGESFHGGFDKAISSFTNALSKESTNNDKAYTYNFRGGMYVKIGKFDEALADYKESIKYRWGNPRPHYSIANIYLRQDHLDIGKAEEEIEILKGLLNEGKLGGGEKAFAEYRIKELEKKVIEAKK